MVSKFITSLMVGLLLYMGLGSFTPENSVGAQANTANQVLQLVNQVRADHGLPPFQANQALMAAAQNQANFNAANSTYGHSGEGGSRPQDRANNAGYSGFVVENVVGGWDLTPQQGVTWWVNSPVHYNTLITTRYTQAGTGFSINGRQNHYTLVVGRPSDQPPSSSPAPQPAGPPAIVVPIILSEPQEDGSIIHEVQTGQTLWAIAARYSIKLDNLRLFNNLQENDIVHPGDKLTIQLAEGEAPPPTPTPPLTHIVKQGETAWTIAARYRLNIEDLIWFNSLSEDAIIQPGDELIIRLAEGQAPPPTPTPLTHHTVNDGDSLWGIAAVYNITIENLLNLNNLDADAILQPGQKLQIRRISTATPTPVENQAEPLLTTPTQPSTPPTSSLVSAVSPVPSAKAPTEETIPQVPSPTPAPVVEARQFEQNAVYGILIAGIGLTVLAGIVAIAIRRETQ